MFETIRRFTYSVGHQHIRSKTPGQLGYISGYIIGAVSARVGLQRVEFVVTRRIAMRCIAPLAYGASAHPGRWARAAHCCMGDHS